MPLLAPILEQVRLTTIIDIGITALLIYWLFSLIRGTRAVRLVIGVSVLVLVYALAIAFALRLLTQILQAGAVVGLFALVVIFQPELRRALERIGRVGSFGWLLSPAESRAVEHVATEVARAAAELSADGQGALIVLERETGLEEVAETGVMIHGDVSADLLRTIFTPRSPLHDGAVIVRDELIVAAGALLPLAETSIHTERFGTRHRAALGITEQTDAVVIVVSEENGQISLVERGRIVRNLTEPRLARAIQTLLDPAGGRRGAFGWRSANQRTDIDGRSPRLLDLGRFVGRRSPGDPPTPSNPGAQRSDPTGGAAAAPGTPAPAPPAARATKPKPATRGSAPADKTAPWTTPATAAPDGGPAVPGQTAAVPGQTAPVPGPGAPAPGQTPEPESAGQPAPDHDDVVAPAAARLPQ